MNRFLAWWLALGGWLLFANYSSAQQSSNTVTFRVTYDATTQLYTAWVVPNYRTPNSYNTGANELVSTAQVTLKVPIGFVIQTILDASGTQSWEKKPARLGPGLSLTATNGNVFTQDYRPAVLDPDYAYYVIGKSPTESNLGAFAVGVPVALFTFSGNGCFGPIQIMPPADPFIQAAYDTYSYNVPNSFYSSSGQPVGGNQDPLEQFIAVSGASADCQPPIVVITGPAMGATVASLNPPISGTATPGSSVTVTGPNGQRCITTAAGPGGTWTCTSLTFVNGPASVTAITSLSGVTGIPVVTNFMVAVPQPPLVRPDSATTTVGVPVSGNVLANDTDPRSGTLIASLIGLPTAGTVTISSTGNYTYTPPANFTGVASFCYSATNTAGLSSSTCVSITVVASVVQLKLKVLLQGALVGNSSTLMRDDLRRQGFLPRTEPYSAIGGPRFTHVNGGGGETMPASVTAQGAGTGNAVVDWVFVELRSPSNLSLVVATRSALVQRDGDVVLAGDGASPLSFTGLAGSSFYVSVKHRNHLGVMTATAVPLSATATLVDFTSATGSQLWNSGVGTFQYEGVEQVSLNGQQAMWAGDASHNGQVKYQGMSNDLITIFGEVIDAQGTIVNPLYNYDQALGYYFGDVNLDGKVKYQGTGNDTSLIFTNVLTNYQSLNSGQLYNFDWMIEQIP